MKKVLLLIISILLISTATYAYETVLINFPPRDKWIAVLHETQGGESILQYVPQGQSSQNWTRTLIFHSYKKNGGFNYNDATDLINTTTAQMEYQNGSSRYKFIKYNGSDSIATRCVKGNSRVPTQCEILRTSTSYEGLISMHYINKNVSDFKSAYDLWYQIIQDIRIYYSYYMDDRILDKATSFEL